MAGGPEREPPAVDAGAPLRLLARALGVETAETPAVGLGMAMMFLLFAGYFLLRPVRETMGVAGGVDNLQWLFTGTFVATLAAIPLYGWIAGRAPRRRILAWMYGFFALNLGGFAVAIALRPDDPWIARGFYIWLSVFSLVSVSVAWSVLADLFPLAAAKRVFGLMAGGASAGGLVGPALAILLVQPLGLPGLMLLATALLLASALAAGALQRWRDRHPLRADEAHARTRPLGGNPFAGLATVLRSPFLLAIALFVVLLASVTTFLYFEQARLVELLYPERERQAQVFAALDVVVQSLALVTQLLLTGRLVRRLGIAVLLCAVPVVMMGGFLWLALAPTFAVFALVMVVRRAGEYALVRPGREMLFTVVPAEAKYKAKNVVDSVAYRGADMVAGWAKFGIDALAAHPPVVYVVGAGLALAWALTGRALARQQQRLAAAGPGSAPG